MHVKSGLGKEGRRKAIPVREFFIRFWGDTFLKGLDLARVNQ